MIAHAAGKPPSNPIRPNASTNPVNESELGSDSRPSEPAEQDDEGVLDPFFRDSIPTPSDLLGEAIDPDAVSDDEPLIPDEPLTEPTDLSSAELDRLGPEAVDNYGFNDTESLAENDDEQGPTTGFGWNTIEIQKDPSDDDSEDGPVEGSLVPLEPLQPLSSDEDDGDAAAAGLPELLVDDSEIPWAKERWSELPLPSAYSARQHLALVGSTLCAAGERTHLINSRDLSPLEDVPVRATTQRVLCLDSEPSRLLLLTSSGQLLLWRRSRKDPSKLVRISVPNGEVISLIWQLAPGVPSISLRLESGRMLYWDDANETLQPASSQAQDDRWRLRALSELGEPRVALWHGPSGARLRIEVGPNAQEVPLNPSMSQDVRGARPLLAGYVDHVLCGVRDHGLYLYGPSHPNFMPIPGCRHITALAAGHMLGRPTAFVGLFSELEDRAEIVAVDLATGRSTRVAEVTILSDDDGPADDPPERARINALLWDPTQSRLWVAGCFGLTCFQPATSKSAVSVRKNADQ
jgi:hypothetical protein